VSNYSYYGGDIKAMHDIRLSIFIAVVEKGSFSAAAESLHITQPAISARIHSLEEYIGVQLFKRDRKGVTLTMAGQTLYKNARLINDLWEQTIKEVQLHSNIFDSRLEIVGSPTVGQYILPSLVKEFKNIYEYINAAILVGNNNEVVSKVINNQAQLGFIAGHYESDKLTIEEILWDEMVLVVSNKHPWVNTKAIEPKEILNDRIILRESSSSTVFFIEQQFKQHGIELNSKSKFFLELGSIEAIKSTVEGNSGCSILSNYAVDKELKSGSLVKVDIKGMSFKRPICAVYRNFNHLPEIYKKFITFVKKNAHTMKID